MFWFFSCAHKRTTWPQTPRVDDRQPLSERRTHVSCLDCGRRFEYSWKDAKMGAEIPDPPRMEVAKR